jgi:hypothetical protein
MRRASLLFGLFMAASSCDFETAFQRYCDESHNCPDAASSPDARDAASAPDLEPPPGDTTSLIRSCGPGLGDCGPADLCINQICRKKCNEDEECPSELALNKCEDVQPRGPGGGPEHIKVCKCTSWQECNSVASGFTCNKEDGLCVPRCIDKADCNIFAQPRVCDIASGECKRPCKDNKECFDPDYSRCDPDTQLCKPCIEAADCYGRPDLKTQCLSGSCIQPT